jgi:hypothetical protein
MLADVHNIQKLHDEMQKEFDDRPLQFFNDVAVPLIPRKMLEEGLEEESPESLAGRVREFLKESDEIHELEEEKAEEKVEEKVEAEGENGSITS